MNIRINDSCGENNLHYAEIPVYTRQQIADCLSSGDANRIILGLLSGALYLDSPGWVEDQCGCFLNHPVHDVAAAALTSMGHLARLHGQLNLERLESQLADLKSRAPLAGLIEDLRDDIEIFILRSRHPLK